MVTGAATHVIDDFMLGEDLEGVGPADLKVLTLSECLNLLKGVICFSLRLSKQS